LPLKQGGEGLHGDPEILGYGKPLVKDGFLQLNDSPGLGINVNEQLLKKYLAEGETWWGD